MVTPNGQALRRWRESLGLSREALGAAAGGVSCSTIVRVEAGEVKPHPATLSALIRALSACSGAIEHKDESPDATEAPRLSANSAGRGRDAIRS
jgi:predicted transcriptional regulator